MKFHFAQMLEFRSEAEMFKCHVNASTAVTRVVTSLGQKMRWHLMLIKQACELCLNVKLSLMIKNGHLILHVFYILLSRLKFNSVSVRSNGSKESKLSMPFAFPMIWWEPGSKEIIIQIVIYVCEMFLAFPKKTESIEYRSLASALIPLQHRLIRGFLCQRKMNLVEIVWNHELYVEPNQVCWHLFTLKAN